MAVVAKYVVVRDGVELEQTFGDKKEAEAYDKMLDAAQDLRDLIKNGDHDLDLEPKVIDEIALVLAKNAATVTKILKAVKPAKPDATGAEKKAQPEIGDAQKQDGRQKAKKRAA
jgi:uncharacterized protein